MDDQIPLLPALPKNLFLQNNFCHLTGMNYDTSKIDQAALAILFVNSWEEGPDQNRAWKSLDWDIAGRLHEQGLISNPVGKAKSIFLTKEGIELAQRVAIELFAKPD